MGQSYDGSSASKLTWKDTSQIKPSAESFAIQAKSSYRQTSNISCTLVGNRIVDHSNLVGASPGVAAPTTSSFLT